MKFIESWRSSLKRTVLLFKSLLMAIYYAFELIFCQIFLQIERKGIINLIAIRFGLLTSQKCRCAGLVWPPENPCLISISHVSHLLKLHVNFFSDLFSLSSLFFLVYSLHNFAFPRKQFPWILWTPKMLTLAVACIEKGFRRLSKDHYHLQQNIWIVNSRLCAWC